MLPDTVLTDDIVLYNNISATGTILMQSHLSTEYS